MRHHIFCHNNVLHKKIPASQNFLVGSYFQGLKNSKNTRFYQEYVKLGNFIIDYVLSGKLDKIFSNQNKK